MCVTSFLFKQTLRKLLAPGFILVSYCIAFTQVQHEIDSLFQRIKTESDTDSIKVKDLFQIGVRYLGQSDYTAAEEYLVKALQLAQKQNNKRGIAWTKSYLGQLYEYKGDYAQALSYYEQGLKLTEEIGDTLGAAHAYGNVGLIQWHLGQYDEAIESHRKSLDLFDNIHNIMGKARAYSNLGEIYEDLGNYPKALENYIAALKIAEEKKFKLGIAISYGNIGTIYGYQKNYNEAIKNYEFSLRTYEEIGEKSGMADAHIKLGGIYSKIQKDTTALFHGTLALNLSQDIGYKAGIAGAHDLIGSIQLESNHFQDALQHLLEALKNWTEMGEKQSIANSNNTIGSIYLRLKQYPEANRFYAHALQLGGEIGAKLSIQDAHLGLSQAKAAMGEYENALLHYQSYVLYKDSLLNEENNKEISRLKEKFASEKKDQAIELLGKEKALQSLDLQKQKQTKGYLLGGLVMVLILSFFIYRYYHANQEMRLLTLRNKIASDLHDDVGSTLSSIYIFSQMAQTADQNVIPAMQTIAESSKKMLDAMTDIVWTINPENDEFEKIIMRMRSFAYELLGASQIDFEFIVDDDIAKIKLPMETRKNLYLIFKEGTNNLVKYAEADKAMFAIKGTGDMLMMMIRDNGKGFDSSADFLGNGLKNMKKRASEIGAQLLIDSEPGSGTMIQLELAV